MNSKVAKRKVGYSFHVAYDWKETVTQTESTQRNHFYIVENRLCAKKLNTRPGVVRSF